MTVDLDRLDALAAAATPGPWSWNSYSGIFGQGAAEPLLVAQVPSRVGDTATAQGAIDAAFIAACDPATIRELVAAAKERDELRAAAEEVVAEAEPDWGDEGWVDYLVPFTLIDALRAALHPEAGTGYVEFVSKAEHADDPEVMGEDSRRG